MLRLECHFDELFVNGCKNRHFDNFQWPVQSVAKSRNDATQIAKFMGPTWGPPGSCRPQMGPTLAPWTLLPGHWLQWRHNGRDSVSSHQPHDCLLNCLFRRTSMKTSKLRVTGLCVENSPLTGEFPAQMASNAENVSIWWRHHVRLGDVQKITRDFYLITVSKSRKVFTGPTYTLHLSFIVILYVYRHFQCLVIWWA